MFSGVPIAHKERKKEELFEAKQVSPLLAHVSNNGSQNIDC